MNSDLYIYAKKGEDNIIYNCIADSKTDDCCYPDILIKHNFTERSIKNNSLYQIATTAMKQYGSSRCFFVTYKDYESYLNLLTIIHNVFPVSMDNSNEALIETFGYNLLLSATMMNSLKILLNYYSITGGNITELINNFTQDNNLPVTTKIKGKKLYEQLRDQILG